MAPSGGKAMRSQCNLLFWRIPQRQIRNLDAGNKFHYVHMILIFTVVISESKSEMIRIVLVCGSCWFMPTLSFKMYR